MLFAKKELLLPHSSGYRKNSISARLAEQKCLVVLFGNYNFVV